MKIDDLVVLRLWENRVGVEVVEVPTAQKREPKLKIDLTKQTWHIEDGRMGRGEEYPVGSKRQFSQGEMVDGVIGVYNSRKKGDIDSIARTAYELGNESGKSAINIDD